jgi:hypothetical protein
MRRITLFTTLALLALPSTALAQQPEDGELSIKFMNGLTANGKRYLTEGQTVVLRGRARPFVAGQRVNVRVTRKGGGKVKTKTLRLRRVGTRNAGQFKLKFVPKATGLHKVTAVHKRTRAQKRFGAVERRKVLDNTASLGSRGIRVRALQKGLKQLGYAGFRVTGYFDSGTARAVLAFRKVTTLGRTTYASTEVFKRVFERRGTFKLKYPNAGKHVEADLSRQVLVLAKDGKPVRIYHTSSGKPSTPTVLGSFRFYRKDAGTNGVGMVHSSYFIGGYAIHGYHSVPTYPASHGCLRVPIPSAWNIYSWIDIGDRIFVYR